VWLRKNYGLESFPSDGDIVRHAWILSDFGVCLNTLSSILLSATLFEHVTDKLSEQDVQKHVSSWGGGSEEVISISKRRLIL